MAQLLHHVHLDQPVDLRGLVRLGINLILVAMQHVAGIAQPLVDRPLRATLQCRQHAATAMMAAQDDVTDLQYIDRVLHHRQQVQVVVMNQIGDVPVQEHAARRGHGHLLGRHSAVGTADPQKVGLLARRLPLEEVGLFLEEFGCPGLIGEQQLLIFPHA